MGYKIGKIYRIYKIDDPTINYIGSTFTTLRQRYSNHKTNKKSCSIAKLFDEYGIDKFKIILIKEYEVYAETQKDTKHLRAYEQLWINKFRLKKSCINKLNPLNIKRFYDSNYYINNKERKIIYQNEYYKKNKDIVLKKANLYHNNNKEERKIYKEGYYEKNKDILLENQKQYYESNKNEINKKRKDKIECPLCKCIINKVCLKRHQKSKKCISLSKK